jgi:hypothetical protein
MCDELKSHRNFFDTCILERDMEIWTNIQREIDKNDLNPDWNEPGKTMFHLDSSLSMRG